MAEEKQFENKVKKWLAEQGIYPAGYPANKMSEKHNGWYFKVWGGGFQKSGIPDLVLNVYGDFVAVELKAQNGHPSDLQIMNVDRIRQSNGQACFLYPSGWERFKDDISILLETGEVRLKEVYK